MAKIDEGKTPEDEGKTPEEAAMDGKDPKDIAIGAALASAGGTSRTETELDAPPNIYVLGHMEGNIAVRLGWRHGMHVVSNSRFKFLKQDLGANVVDDESKYLF